MKKDSIIDAVTALGPWYHNITLPFGIQTNPEQKTPARGDNYYRLINALPKDMTGLSVLDIGTNAGAFAIEAARRGARRVVGFDYSEKFISQAKFCAELLDLPIEYHCATIDEFLPSLNPFDIVIFVGVLYHTHDPIRISRLVRKVTKNFCIVETVGTSPEYRDEPFGIIQFPRPSITHSGWTWINNEGLRYIYQDICGFKKIEFLFSGGRTAFVASVNP